MSADCPRVSIGMPVYNGAAHLPAALDSVLAQTFTDFELILCDNASTDGTEQIGRAYAARDGRIRYQRNEQNLGAAENFNRTFELAGGEYFKWFAHDDILEPVYLERCVAALDNDSGAAVLCFTERLEMTHDGMVLGRDSRRRIFEASPPYDGISWARLMRVPERRYPTLVFGVIRCDALRRTRLMGAYNCADLVLVAELRLLGSFREVPEPLFLNRLHEETPEFKVRRRTFTGEAAWYDPQQRRRFLLPEVKLFVERLRAVRRFDLGVGRKVWCYVCVVYGQVVGRWPAWLALRALRLKRKVRGVWERLSVATIERSSKLCLPHRIWAFLSGLRHRDRRRLAAAVSWPSPASRIVLLEFVARRLSRRRDPSAAGLLRRWLNHPGEEYRAVASAVTQDGDGRGDGLREEAESRDRPAGKEDAPQRPVTGPRV